MTGLVSRPLTTDRILDVIDAGLQSSPEPGYGTDHTPGMCARCQHTELTDGDLCSPCRAFLLGDTDKDQRRGMTPDEAAAQMQALADAIVPAIERVLDGFRTVVADWIEQTGKAMHAFVELIEAVQAEEPEPTHRRSERSVLDQHRRSHRRTNRWGPPPGRR